MSEMNGAAGNNSAGEDRPFVHFSFYKLLRVPLPWGLLEQWAF